MQITVLQNVMDENLWAIKCKGLDCVMGRMNHHMRCMVYIGHLEHSMGHMEEHVMGHMKEHIMGLMKEHVMWHIEHA